MNLLPRQGSPTLSAKMKGKCDLKERSPDALLAPAVARNREAVVALLQQVMRLGSSARAARVNTPFLRAGMTRPAADS